MSRMTGPQPSDRFIPWGIALFFAVQAIGFAWFYRISTATSPGLVTDSAYEKGLQYNDVIAKAAAQDLLGWTSAITRKNEGIEFALRDGQGKPLAGARAHLWLVRPVHDGEDRQLEMKETAPGHYFAALAVPEKGLWEARIRAETPKGAYQSSERIVFK
ncbi:MAG: FixH family protein [Alphaproteobacteria bacterium]|nr:FixH family protein [Alphaproteobacteria bacterium]